MVEGGKALLPTIGIAAVEPMNRKSSLRVSQRLTTGESSSILSKAISRKVSLRKGDRAAEASERASRISNRKIMAKSRLCGVRLDDVQASSFKEFVRH